jgi:peptidoglycan/xylan/chitin deacetylase (PgdA/CDA1 family)
VSSRALVLTYHAIELGPAPLCIEPALFREHLDVIAEAPVRPVGLDRLAAELEAGGPVEASVAITFDDGYASVVRNAAPMLAERGLPATVFCVAGHLGGLNDWTTEPRSGARLRLASAGELGGVAAGGLQLGSHGLSHYPLSLADEDLEPEIVESRARLQHETGAAVRWFAHPYGSLPGARGRSIIERTYNGAVASGNRAVSQGTDRWRIPRVEVHYLRRPGLLRRTLEGRGSYLAVRRVGAHARRLVRSDYEAP